jgi:hypothetical protein
MLNNCTLSGNSARYGGGASDSMLNNCALSGNSARYGGGAYGFYMDDWPSITLNNCTLSGNSATYGGGAYGDYEGYGDDLPSIKLNNCIVYYNSAQFGLNYGGSSTFYYSCTTPLPFGYNNLLSAPLFVDYAAGDLRLQSNSPCINRGANSYALGPTDLHGDPRIVNGTVDIGACEWQVPATFAPLVPPGPGGLDLTLSGEVGRIYDLHVSSNLVTWVWLIRLTNSSGQATYTDPLTPCPPARFYKATPIP